ncbi:hypothetical protein BOX15_Mlig002182g122 [Macrostomum lignano]|nr:hypothetical protein BOX15_Mlig002182g144 [Macrostomum lignano]PAA82180.1 hypothetical protein BOX15_Mlig002182g122 [Macrostomum lignano]
MPRLNESEAAEGGWQPVVNMPESDLIYDMCWYPSMNSADPDTCCFAACSRDNPVRLWDAFTGQQRAQYAPYNHLDELQAPYSLAFSPDGSRLYCGFERHLRVFDIHRPGKQSERRPRIGVKPSQGGIIAALACTPARPGVYACGSYNRTVCLFAEPGSMLACMRGQLGGVTQLQFSPCGNLLYSGGRKDPEIHCWDVRRPGVILATMRRVVATNQRLQFDLDPGGRYLLSPCYTGRVRVFDLKTPPAPTNCEINYCAEWQAHADACNTVSLSPTCPVLATCSGQRHIRSMLADASSSSSSTYSEDETDQNVENRLRLFSLSTCLDNSRFAAN